MTDIPSDNRRRASRNLSAVLLGLCAVPLCAAGAGPQNGDPVVADYRLESLALGLRQAPNAVRAELAGIALDELSAAYAQESLRARGEARRHSPEHELRRWADAVDRLAAQLAALAGTITSTTPVTIGFSPDRSLYLVVDGEPALLSGPRTAQQAALEQRIVRRFCSLHPCQRPPVKRARPEPAATRAVANPHWSFSEAAGPVCSSGDGLDFAFTDSDNLLQKRAGCARAIDELYALAEAVSQRVSNGSRIDWDHLAIHRAAGETTHYVELDRNSPPLRLHLPLLGAAPRLLSLVRPWLAARVAGRQHRVQIENAAQLLSVPREP